MVGFEFKQSSAVFNHRLDQSLSDVVVNIGNDVYLNLRYWIILHISYYDMLSKGHEV
jgi:hypothetical protein